MDGKVASGPANAGQNPEEALQLETLEAQLASLREEECESVFAGAGALVLRSCAAAREQRYGEAAV